MWTVQNVADSLKHAQEIRTETIKKVFMVAIEKNGWIKLHRKMLDNPIIMKDADHLAVWMYLLLNATHAEYPALFKGQKIMLQPGQLITGRKSLAEKLSINESKIRRILDSFEDDQQIDRQQSNKNTLISLRNWDKYQVFDQQSDANMYESCTKSDQQNDQQKNPENADKMGFCGNADTTSDQQNGQQVTNKRPTNGQQVTTNKNVKNIKNDKNVIKKDIYGEYRHVLLSDKEFEKLGKDFGCDVRDKAIDFLDAYIEEKGYKSKSHNLAIRRWVIEAVKDKQRKQTAKPIRQEVVPKWMAKEQRQYDFDDLESQFLANGTRTAANDPDIRARADALRQQFGG